MEQMNKLLFALICLFLPLTLFAFSEAHIYLSIGYVIFIPIFIGLLEGYLIENKIKARKVKETEMWVIILVTYFVIISGFFIAVYLVDLFQILNTRIELLVLMIVLTALQVVCKTQVFRFLKIVPVIYGFKVAKILFLETVLINSLFYLLMVLI
jgi:hypothetical protein